MEEKRSEEKCFEEKRLREIVQRMVLCEAAKAGDRYVPVMTSARHVHLSRRDVERLFGAGYRLTKLRELGQPGQYVCRERIAIETPKGKLLLRVLGPTRDETQVELSVSDGFALGLALPVRMSGDLAGSPGCVLTNGDRRAELKHGAVVAMRHLHIAPEEAAVYGVKDGDMVALAVEGQRGMLLQQVIVRAVQGHVLEAHIDTDEANACGLQDGQLCRLVSGVGASALEPMMCRQAEQGASAPKPPAMLDVSGEPRRLLTEEDVRNAADDGYRRIRYAKCAVLTPLARDMASDKGIELICVE